MPRNVKLPDDKLQQARELKSEAEHVYSERNNKILEMREWRYGEVPADIPKAYEKTAKAIKVPLAGDVIDRMVGILNEAPWHAKVVPYGPGPEAQKNSSLREKWSEAAIATIEQHELARPVVNMVTDCQIGDGMGVCKVIYNKASWRSLPSAKSVFGRSAAEISVQEARELSDKQEEAKRMAPLPFRIVDVIPLNYYPFHGPDGELDAVIEINRRPLRGIKRQYGADIASELGRMGESMSKDEEFGGGQAITEWQYWDRETYAIYLNDIPVVGGKHSLGQVPYFECYAQQRADRDPSRYALPPVYNLISLIQSIQNMLTMGQNAMFLTAFPTPVLYTPLGVEVPKGADGRPRGVRIEQGRMLTLFQGQEIKYLEVPIENLKMIDAWAERCMRLFEMLSGLGPALRGIGGADQPGYALNQLITASMTVLNPAVRSRDLMLARVIAFIWRLIENTIQDTVWVWGENPADREGQKKKGKQMWLGLGPHDIKHYYSLTVETKPLMAQQRIAQGAFAKQMASKPTQLLSKRAAIEDFMGYANPEEMMDEMWVEDAIEQGPLADQVKMDAVKKAGMSVAGPEPEALPPPPGVAGGQPGMPNAAPPAGPGVGMPITPEAPPMPGPTEGQMQDQAGYSMPGGRPAGSGQQPPVQAPVPIRP